jgi:hypothetical protein
MLEMIGARLPLATAEQNLAYPGYDVSDAREPP